MQPPELAGGTLRDVAGGAREAAPDWPTANGYRATRLRHVPGDEVARGQDGAARHGQRPVPTADRAPVDGSTGVFPAGGEERQLRALTPERALTGRGLTARALAPARGVWGQLTDPVQALAGAVQNAAVKGPLATGPVRLVPDTTAHVASATMRLAADATAHVTSATTQIAAKTMQRAATTLQLAADAVGFAQRQFDGGREGDRFGFDPEFNDRVLLPVARLFYRHWFRVEIRGLEHVPAAGPSLIVANHSGTLPMDAIMLQTGLHDSHPAHRNLRLLGADLIYEIPVLASLARKGGHIRACPANALALLGAGEVVGVFPEGFKGIGKPFAERYQLQRFGRGGFAVTAIRARVPIIPCAIVGAEEIYPMIGNAKRVAKLLGLPYFPITPIFPWLGVAGTVPLPSRWIIEFCPPVATAGCAAGAEHDPAVVTDLSGRVRGTIQRKLHDLLAERGPAFG